MEFLNSLSTLTLDSAYVQHTLFAFASLFMGLLGLVLGQKVSNGKVTLVIGLLMGGLAVFLFFTPFGHFAPGFLGVFVVTFLISDPLMKLVSGSGFGFGGPKKKGPANGPTSAA
jgi:hypothetical protein